VLDVYPAFEGQFLCIEACGAPTGAEIGVEAATDMNSLTGMVSEFTDRYRTKVRASDGIIERLFATRHKVVLWGTGSKGVTFLNTVMRGDQIPYTVDINPRKRSRYVPGTGQEIVAPEFLRNHPADTVLITNPLYQAEVMALLSGHQLKAEIVLV